MGFKECFDKIIDVEGKEYTNRPNDNGGPTKFGITLKTLQQWRNYQTVIPSDVENLTIKEAYEIYEAMYWKHYLLDHVTNETIADILMDQFVNRNPIGVVMQIQRGLRGCGINITVDGIIGVQTISAINNVHPRFFGLNFVKDSQLFYARVCQKDPTQLENLAGWLARTHKMLDDILNQ